MPNRDARLDHDYWLVTWTTYGSWLPGDRRGSTSRMWAASGGRVRHNLPTQPPAPPAPRLERWARNHRRDPLVHLTGLDADVLLRQFQTTASIRGWLLVAVAVMGNHVHLVVGTDGEIDPSDLLRDFKRYGSRALNERDGTPGRRRWTKSGSRQRLRVETNVAAAIDYIRKQYQPLIVWLDEASTSR